MKYIVMGYICMLDLVYRYIYELFRLSPTLPTPLMKFINYSYLLLNIITNGLLIYVGRISNMIAYCQNDF